MKSSLGKRKQRRVRHVIDNIGEYAKRIQVLLQYKLYVPSPYILKTVEDGATKKKRQISKPKYYPDQIIHWALMLALEPLVMRGMYVYNCGSVPERGTASGQKAIRKWLDGDRRGTKYCLKMDISKFYPSVDNGMLKQMFRKRIKDADCLWLIDKIIDSATGLPIGNYTSQWFANFFLQDLDHIIKERLRVPYYVRYVDDIVLLGPNKKKLHAAKKEIETYLKSVHLTLKANWQVSRVDKRAIDFLGFRFFRDHTEIRKRNALRIRRRIRKISKKPHLGYKDACAIISYWGWIKRTNSYRFYANNVRPNVSIKKARKVVSLHAKIRSHRQWKIVAQRSTTQRIQTSTI